jgi:hypothetical protein
MEASLMEGDHNPGCSAPDVQDDPPEKTGKQNLFHENLL